MELDALLQKVAREARREEQRARADAAEARKLVGCAPDAPSYVAAVSWQKLKEAEARETDARRWAIRAELAEGGKLGMSQVDDASWAKLTYSFRDVATRQKRVAYFNDPATPVETPRG